MTHKIGFIFVHNTTGHIAEDNYKNVIVFATQEDAMLASNLEGLSEYTARPLVKWRKPRGKHLARKT